MCVYQNVNAPNHALLEVRNHEDGTFELVALNTTYGSSQAGNATVTVKVVALERDVDVWITELWHKLPIATEVLTHLLTNCFLVMKGLSIFLIPLEVGNIFEQAFDFGLLVFFLEALIVALTENDSMFASPAVPTRSGRSVTGCAGGASGT